MADFNGRWLSYLFVSRPALRADTHASTRLCHAVSNSALTSGVQCCRCLAQNGKHGAHDLRLTAETIWILHSVVVDQVGCANRATCEQSAQRPRNINLALMATKAEVTGPINLGNPEEFSILELAKLIIEITGSRSKVVHRPLPQDDPRQRCPDISEAQRLLNWRPKTSLKEGLSRAVSYFERLLAEGTLERAIFQ